MTIPAGVWPRAAPPRRPGRVALARRGAASDNGAWIVSGTGGRNGGSRRCPGGLARRAGGVQERLDEWYQREHLSERLAVPGFRTGRRYRGSGDGPGFLALYETDDVGVLASPAYSSASPTRRRAPRR